LRQKNPRKNQSVDSRPLGFKIAGGWIYKSQRSIAKRKVTFEPFRSAALAPCGCIQQLKSAKDIDGAFSSHGSFCPIYVISDEA